MNVVVVDCLGRMHSKFIFPLVGLCHCWLHFKYWIHWPYSTWGSCYFPFMSWTHRLMKWDDQIAYDLCLCCYEGGKIFEAGEHFTFVEHYCSLSVPMWRYPIWQLSIFSYGQLSIFFTIIKYFQTLHLQHCILTGVQEIWKVSKSHGIFWLDFWPICEPLPKGSLYDEGLAISVVQFVSRVFVSLIIISIESSFQRLTSRVPYIFPLVSMTELNEACHSRNWIGLPLPYFPQYRVHWIIRPLSF